MSANPMNVIQALLAAQGQGQQGPATAGGGAVNTAGLPAGINLPGVGSAGAPVRGPQTEDLSKAQAGGPDARTPKFEQDKRTWFNNAQEIRAASQQNAVGALMSSMQQAKQNKFEKQSSEAAVVFSAKIAQQTLDAAASSKTELPPQEVAQLRQQVEMASKIKNPEKLIEMAMKDPMSGAHVGFARANSMESKRQAVIAEQDKAKQAMMIKEIMAGVAQQRASQQGDANDIKQQEENRKKQADKDKPILQDMKQNFKRPVVDEQGNLQRSPDGTLMSREMSKEDIKGNPELEQKYQEKKQKIQSMIDKSKAEAQDSYSKRIAANAAMIRANKATSQADREKLKSGAGGTGRAGSAGGAIMARNTMLAGMANEYLGQMKTIATKRPDLFGPSGLFGSKMEQAAGDGDRDAMEYIKLAQAASLPLSGIHNMRNQKVVGDVEKTLRSQWQSPQSALDGIKTYQDTAQGVIEGKYTGASQASPQANPTQSSAPSQTKTGPKKVIIVTAEDIK